MLGTRTWDSMMEGADKSTELWRHPAHKNRCKPPSCIPIRVTANLLTLKYSSRLVEATQITNLPFQQKAGSFCKAS